MLELLIFAAAMVAVWAIADRLLVRAQRRMSPSVESKPAPEHRADTRAS